MSDCHRSHMSQVKLSHYDPSSGSCPKMWTTPSQGHHIMAPWAWALDIRRHHAPWCLHLRPFLCWPPNIEVKIKLHWLWIVPVSVPAILAAHHLWWLALIERIIFVPRQSFISSQCPPKCQWIVIQAVFGVSKHIHLLAPSFHIWPVQWNHCHFALRKWLQKYVILCVFPFMLQPMLSIEACHIAWLSPVGPYCLQYLTPVYHLYITYIFSTYLPPIYFPHIYHLYIITHISSLTVVMLLSKFKVKRWLKHQHLQTL